MKQGFLRAQESQFATKIRNSQQCHKQPKEITALNKLKPALYVAWNIELYMGENILCAASLVPW